MKRFAWLLVAAACQSGSSSAPPPRSTEAAAAGAGAGSGIPRPFVSDAYRKDIDSLCNVMKLSGADQQPPDARQVLIAIQPLHGEAKAAELDGEARRVGLSSCPLADEWRTAPH